MKLALWVGIWGMAVTSALLCLATCVVWVESYKAEKTIRFRLNGELWLATSRAGNVRIDNKLQRLQERVDIMDRRSALQMSLYGLRDRWRVAWERAKVGPEVKWVETPELKALEAERSRIEREQHALLYKQPPPPVVWETSYGVPATITATAPVSLLLWLTCRRSRAMFTAVSAASALLCVATSAAWARSYFANDGFRWTSPSVSMASVYLARGRLVYQRWDVEPSRPSRGHDGPTFVSHQPAADPFLRISRDKPLFDSGGFVLGVDTGGGSAVTVIRFAVVPFWSIIPFTLVLPSVWFVSARHLRRRADLRAAGRCERCGYDLRASPHRCPECGTEVKVIWGEHRNWLHDPDSANPITPTQKDGVPEIAAGGDAARACTRK